jgi:hypothetical protein
MLKMGPRLSNIARPPQAHPTNSLGMNPFYACSPSVLFLELLGLLQFSVQLLDMEDNSIDRCKLMFGNFFVMLLAR